MDLSIKTIKLPTCDIIIIIFHKLEQLFTREFESVYLSDI